MTWSGAANNPKIQGHYQNNLLQIYGSLELQSGMQYHVGTTYFKSNVAGQTIKTNGTSIGAAGYSDYRGNITFDGTGSWELLDDFSTTERNKVNFGKIELTKGHFKTNSHKVTIGYFDSNNSNVRSVTLGSSEIRVEYGMYGWKYKGSNRSLSSGTSHIILTADMSDPTYVRANYAFAGDLNDVYYQITYENPASTVRSFSGGIKAQKVTFYGNAYIYGSNLFDTLIFVNGGKFYFERAKNQTIYKAFFSSGTPCLSSGLLDLGTTGSLPKIEVKSGNLNYDS